MREGLLALRRALTSRSSAPAGPLTQDRAAVAHLKKLEAGWYAQAGVCSAERLRRVAVAFQLQSRLQSQTSSLLRRALKQSDAARVAGAEGDARGASRATHGGAYEARAGGGGDHSGRSDGGNDGTGGVAMEGGRQSHHQGAQLALVVLDAHDRLCELSRALEARERHERAAGDARAAAVKTLALLHACEQTQTALHAEMDGVLARIISEGGEEQREEGGAGGSGGEGGGQHAWLSRLRRAASVLRNSTREIRECSAAIRSGQLRGAAAGAGGGGAPAVLLGRGQDAIHRAIAALGAGCGRFLDTGATEAESAEEAHLTGSTSESRRLAMEVEAMRRQLSEEREAANVRLAAVVGETERITAEVDKLSKERDAVTEVATLERVQWEARVQELESELERARGGIGSPRRGQVSLGGREGRRGLGVGGSPPQAKSGDVTEEVRDSSSGGGGGGGGGIVLSAPHPALKGVIIGSMCDAAAARCTGARVVSVLEISDAAPLEPSERRDVIALFAAKAAQIASHIDQGHRVFVHCMHGKNRSVAATVAYLVMHRGVGLEEAWEHVKRLRHQANVRTRNTFHRELARIASGKDLPPGCAPVSPGGSTPATAGDESGGEGAAADEAAVTAAVDEATGELAVTSSVQRGG